MRSLSEQSCPTSRPRAQSWCFGVQRSSWRVESTGVERAPSSRATRLACEKTSWRLFEVVEGLLGHNTGPVSRPPRTPVTLHTATLSVFFTGSLPLPAAVAGSFLFASARRELVLLQRAFRAVALGDADGALGVFVTYPTARVLFMVVFFVSACIFFVISSRHRSSESHTRSNSQISD